MGHTHPCGRLECDNVQQRWTAGRRQLLAIDTGKLYGGRGDFLPVAEAIA
ncbi:hypothetical protein [Mesorhizobium sp. M0029]